MPTTGAEAPDRTIRLETARLILRPLSLADAPAIERYASDWEVARHTSHIPHPYPAGAAAEWLVTRRDDPDKPPLWGIERRDGELIGCIELRQRMRPPVQYQFIAKAAQLGCDDGTVHRLQRCDDFPGGSGRREAAAAAKAAGAEAFCGMGVKHGHVHSSSHRREGRAGQSGRCDWTHRNARRPDTIPHRRYIKTAAEPKSRSAPQKLNSNPRGRSSDSLPCPLGRTA